MTSTTRPAPGPGNIRNGTRAKTVLTEASRRRCEIEVPRDRAGTFEPQIVKKRQRRLTGVDEIVLSLYAKGLTTGEISRALRRDLRRVGVEGDDLPDHRQGDRGDAATGRPGRWRGLRGGVHRRDRGQGPRRAGRQPAVLRRDRGHLDGDRDILGLWAGTGGEGAKFWMSVLTDLRNRGVKDVFFVVCDGLKGLPEVVGERLAASDRADLHHPSDPQHVPAASRKYWDELKRDLKPIYTAVNATAARAAFDELDEKWGAALPGDDPALGQRLGRVHPVPGLRRRDPHGALLAPTRSSRSTPATGGRSRPAATSRPSRPR